MQAAIGEIRVIPFLMRYQLSEQVHLVGEFQWIGKKAHNRHGCAFADGNLDVFADTEKDRIRSAFSGFAFGNVFVKSKTISETLQWKKVRNWNLDRNSMFERSAGQSPQRVMTSKRPMSA